MFESIYVVAIGFYTAGQCAFDGGVYHWEFNNGQCYAHSWEV